MMCGSNNGRWDVSSAQASYAEAMGGEDSWTGDLQEGTLRGPGSAHYDRNREWACTPPDPAPLLWARTRMGRGAPMRRVSAVWRERTLVA